MGSRESRLVLIWICGGNEHGKLLRKALLTLLAVVCIAFCFSGCKSGEKQNLPPTNDEPQSETGPNAEHLVPDKETTGEAESALTTALPNIEKDGGPYPFGPQEEKLEEETIESVYRNGAEETMCIFTSGGNNGTGFLYKEKYVITNAHVLYDADDFTLQDVNGQVYEGSIVFEDDNTDMLKL